MNHWKAAPQISKNVKLNHQVENTTFKKMLIRTLLTDPWKTKPQNTNYHHKWQHYGKIRIATEKLRNIQINDARKESRKRLWKISIKRNNCRWKCRKIKFNKVMEEKRKPYYQWLNVSRQEFSKNVYLKIAALTFAFFPVQQLRVWTTTWILY